MKRIFYLTLCTVLLASVFSCKTTKAITKADRYSGMYAEKPQVMMIMPPINKSTDAEAKEFFYTTMNVPIAEAGYYVLPPVLTMQALRRESAYDAELYYNGNLKKFHDYFGADVCIFTIIKSWEKNAVLGIINIEVEYVFKSAKTNAILFERNCDLVADSNVHYSGDSIVSALVAVAADAIIIAVTDYTNIAAECNRYALSDLPAGKYRGEQVYCLDGDTKAYPKEIFREISY